MKLSSRSLFSSRAAVLLALAGFLAAPAQAAAPKAKKPAAAPPSDAVFIASITPANHLVILTYKINNTSHPYTIDEHTSVLINGQSGNFGQLVAGAKVVDHVERNSSTLDTISVIQTPVASAAKASKKHKAKK